MYTSLKSAIQWGSSKNNGMPKQSDLCETCGRKPKYVENGFKHPYCSRTCARGNQAKTTSPAPLNTCSIRGCRAPPAPSLGGFCSDVHAREAVKNGQAKGCAQCKTHYASAGALCVSCDKRNKAGPRLREIDPNGVTFSSVVSQFEHEWHNSRSQPKVEKILEISLPWDLRNSYDMYRTKLGSVACPRELRTYHASQCICDLGVRDTVLCNWDSCGICNIIKSSFHAFAFGELHNAGRYGEGVYSYLDPANADVHATSSLSSPYRAMLACDVVIASRNDRYQVDDGETVFVFDPDAILPSYVILYKTE
ncbi:hypothetical protein ABKN59_007005 [Abortiporus biennis]